MNFPGSKKAALECLEVIEGCIPHAVSLILDRKSEVKRTHEVVQGSGGCSCSSNRLDTESEDHKSVEECSKLTSSVSIFKKMFLVMYRGK